MRATPQASRWRHERHWRHSKSTKLSRAQGRFGRHSRRKPAQLGATAAPSDCRAPVHASRRVHELKWARRPRAECRERSQTATGAGPILGPSKSPSSAQS